jgi:hypothetical protein
MSEFWINFCANLASDALLAVAIYFIVTQPGEKRKYAARRDSALGLLKSEAEINRQRAVSYFDKLSLPDSVTTSAFPMRFTRGAWNALKETGLLAELDDPTLAYRLFRMNELAMIANRNLRRFELAHLEETGGKISELGELTRKDCANYLANLDAALSKLQGIESVQLDAQAFSIDPGQNGNAENLADARE